jgi:uncharacterized protein with LGFP repeats
MRRTLALLTALAVSSLVPSSAAVAAASPAAAPATAVAASDLPDVPDEPLDVQDVPLVVDGQAAADADPSAARAASPGDDADAADPEPGSLVADVVVADGRVATPAVTTSGTDTVGVTWPEDADANGLDLQVRTRVDGTWTDWQPVEAEESPDAGTADAERAVRGGTEALWIGGADAVQVSLDAGTGVAVDDLALAMVGTDPVAATEDAPADPGVPAATPVPTPSPTPVPTAEPEPVPEPTADPSSSPGAAEQISAAAPDAVVRTAAWTPAATATTGDVTAGAQPAAVRTAASAAPAVISRAQWGAPAPVCTPDVAGSLVGAVVHHTANPNTYSTVAEAMAVLRADAAYHISSRGWCDIGYNFVVDKWGNTYEGRAGSLNQPVIGVHAGGFNTGTVGVAMLGTYDALPSNATQAAVGKIIGYRLGMYRVDPRGSMAYKTGVGENSKYQNTTVNLPRVFGHRDVSYTACPGNGGYAALPTIRAVAWDASQAAWGTPPSSLMRTAGDATVYLLASGTLHPVKDMGTLSAYSALGPITYVSKQYLAYWKVGPTLSRAVVTSTGTVAFVDANIRLAFGSCAEVADFGLSCDTAARLDAAQTAKLHNGGRMQRLYRTTTGKTFYITGSVKREVADDASRAAAGIPTSSVTLTDSGLAYLRYGAPVIRDGLLLVERSGPRSIATAAAGNLYLNSAMRAVPGLAAGTTASLDQASIVQVPTVASGAPFVRAGDGSTWFLSEAGRARVTGAATPASAPTLADAVLDRVPQTTAVPEPFLVKPSTGSTVSVVRAGTLSPVRSWSDLVRLAGTSSPTIRTVSGPLLALVPTGAPYTPPGTLARTASSASVFLLDGAAGKIPVSTFSVTAELGISRLTVVPDADLGGRTDSGAALRTIVDCGSQRLIGLGGRAWPIATADRGAFPSATTALDAETCAALTRSDRPASRFLRTPDGTIYWVDGGTKRPIGSMARFAQLGGSSATMIAVSDFAAGRIPTGARA